MIKYENVYRGAALDYVHWLKADTLAITETKEYSLMWHFLYFEEFV